MYYDMTSNFNLKIYALRHLGLSGMIWYQGESDVILGKTPEQYASMFDLMQRSYTELFGYKNGRLPVVYTQLVSYPYLKDNGIDLADMNIGFADMQTKQADSRAVISVYDVSLSYTKELGSIHPECKMEIGERMARSAMGLVYGDDVVYTTATVSNSYMQNGKIYVDFNNVGDGLVCDGSVLKGFAVAGADGVYVQADAEITDKDTVVIYNEKIESPVSATYAYALGNMRSNLYASENGKKALPVSSFVTEKIDGTSYWYEKQWADCDDESIWHIKDDAYTAEYCVWECENANLAFEYDSAFSGDNGLHITDSAESFCVSPVLGARDGLLNVKFSDEGYDCSDYGSICFKVRNNGSEAVTFDSARIYADAIGWYSTVGSETVIPADGKWYIVEVKLNNLNFYGVDLGIPLSNEILEDIADIKFFFSGDDADISFDDVRFVSENEDDSYTPVVNILCFLNVFKIIPIFLRSLLEYIFA